MQGSERVHISSPMPLLTSEPPLPRICTVCQDVVKDDACARGCKSHVVLDLAAPGRAVVQAGRVFLERLSTDARSVTFLARHETLGRLEAAKVIEEQGPQVRELKRRARLFGGLQHEGAARVHDLFEVDGNRDELVEAPMVFLEYIPGSRLETVMQRGAVPAETAVRWICDLCGPLAELHRQQEAFGVLHPRLLVVVGELPGRLRLADFGMDDTPVALYAAPDRDPRQANPVDDVFALGALLVQMLLGPDERPASVSRGMLAALDVPERLREVLARMLCRRLRRLRDAGEVAEALQAAVDAQTVVQVTSESAKVAALLSSDYPEVRPPKSRRRWMAAALVALLAGVAGWMMTSAGRAPEPEASAAATLAGGTQAADRVIAGSERPRAVEAVTAAPAERVEPAQRVEPAPAVAAALDEATASPVDGAVSRDPEPPAPSARDASALGAGALLDAAPTARSQRAATVPAIVWPELTIPTPPRLPLARGVPVRGGGALYIARREVTGAQWSDLTRGEGPPVRGTGLHAVTEVDLCEAAWFLNRLSEAEGLTICYEEPALTGATGCKRIRRRRPCTGYRLPTREEWRAVARAGGSDPRREARRRFDLDAVTCSAPADALGLCELYGGVWEWTETPLGRKGYYRVGGCWDRDHRNVFEQALANQPRVATNYLGFRPVREIAAKPIEIGRLTIDLYADDLRGPRGRRPLARSRSVLLALVRHRGHLAVGAYEPADVAALRALLIEVGLPDIVRDDGEGLHLSPQSTSK